jgi:outer membrane lipoprotein-sorting protein
MNDADVSTSVDRQNTRHRRRHVHGALWPLALAIALIVAAAHDGAHAQAPSAEDLLRSADRARGGLATGITWNATVEATEEGATTTRTFLVKARGNDALVEALAPPRYRGEVMLFNDRTIWFVKPGLRKPVSISARQRLSGEAANGDIASTNYARDYEGTIVGEERVDGEPAYLLDLKARSRNVTYDRIRYWVSKKRQLGLRAEFLTVGGDLFKRATFQYGNRMKSPAGDLEFVSKMTITDASGAGGTTVITFGAPRAETHPLSLFNINNVVR